MYRSRFVRFSCSQLRIRHENRDPFQAFIFRQVNGKPIYRCGASIISNRHILTAASCVDGLERSQLSVFAGKSLAVKKIIPHYLYSDKKNNIAVVELAQALNDTPSKAISFNSTNPLDDAEAIALGVLKGTQEVSPLNL